MFRKKAIEFRADGCADASARPSCFAMSTTDGPRRLACRRTGHQIRYAQCEASRPGRVSAHAWAAEAPAMPCTTYNPPAEERAQRRVARTSTHPFRRAGAHVACCNATCALHDCSDVAQCVLHAARLLIARWMLLASGAHSLAFARRGGVRGATRRQCVQRGVERHRLHRCSAAAVARRADREAAATE